MPERATVCKSGIPNGISKAFTGLQPGAIGKFERGNLLAALQFDVADLERVCGSTGNEQVPSFDLNLSRCGARHLFRRRATGKMAKLPAEIGKRPGPGSEAAHAIVDLLNRLLPSDASVLAFEHGCQRGLLMVLWLWGDAARGDAEESFDHEVGPGERKALREFRRGLIGTDG